MSELKKQDFLLQALRDSLSDVVTARSDAHHSAFPLEPSWAEKQ